MNRIAKNQINVLNHILEEFELKPNGELVSNGSNFVKADLDETFYIRLYFKTENDYHGFVELRSVLPGASLIRRCVYSSKEELNRVLEIILCCYGAERDLINSRQEREETIKVLKKERDQLRKERVEYSKLESKLCLDQKDSFRDLLIDTYPCWEVHNLTFEFGNQTYCLIKRRDGFRVSDVANMREDYKDFENLDRAIEYAREKMSDNENIRIIL